MGTVENNSKENLMVQILLSTWNCPRTFRWSGNWKIIRLVRLNNILMIEKTLSLTRNAATTPYLLYHATRKFLNV